MASLLSYALTTVADVKESLGIASSDTTKDNLITRQINKSTRAIESYCGRRFKETSYTRELYSATGTDQLILKQRPLTSTTPLVFEIRNTGLNDVNFETIDSQLYFCDVGSHQGDAGVIDLMFFARGRWDRYAVTYSAGYTTIPEDLAEACASLACYYVQNIDASDVGVQLKKEGAREVRYANASLKFKTICENLGIDEILDSYANNPLMTDR